MGIFYSYCPECNTRVCWFLDPKVLPCKKCGHEYTEKELWDSLFKGEDENV